MEKILASASTRDANSQLQLDTSEDPTGRLKVYLFNVGQGDHILLELPNGEFGIVDFYYEGPLGFKEPPALTYLKNLKRQEPTKPIIIAFVCISHPDSDHIKGVDSFLEWISDNDILVRNFWLPPGKEIGELSRLYESALKKYARNAEQRDWGNEYKERLAGVHEYLRKHEEVRKDYLQGAFRLLESNLSGVSIVLVAPLTRQIKELDEKSLDDFFRLLIQEKSGRRANNNLMSSVLLMIMDKHRLLFGGDTVLEIWLECLKEFDETGQQKYYGPFEGSFIKASHHGAKDASSVELWLRILSKRSKVGISAGKGHGHPHEQTLRDIQAAARQLTSCQIFTTNTCTDCLINRELPREELVELTYLPDYSPEMRETLRWITPQVTHSAPEDAKQKSLASYLFRFPVNDDNIKVNKGFFPTTFDRVECPYPESHHKHFPACATGDRH